MEINTTFDKSSCTMTSSSMFLLIFLPGEEITFYFSISSFQTARVKSQLLKYSPWVTLSSTSAIYSLLSFFSHSLSGPGKVTTSQRHQSYSLLTLTETLRGSVSLWQETCPNFHTLNLAVWWSLPLTYIIGQHPSIVQKEEFQLPGVFLCLSRVAVRENIGDSSNSIRCHTWPFGFVSLDASQSEYDSTFILLNDLRFKGEHLVLMVHQLI